MADTGNHDNDALDGLDGRGQRRVSRFRRTATVTRGAFRSCPLAAAVLVRATDSPG
jgi:hypothetical protein